VAPVIASIELEIEKPMVTFNNSKVFAYPLPPQEGIYLFPRHMHVTVADTQAAKNAAFIKELLTIPETGATLCPVRDVMDRIGDKWSLLTILNLGSTDRLRFNELRKHIDGISQRMLTVTLRSLESDGLVSRTVYAEVPPRVEYCLTALGQSLLTAVIELGKWAKTYAPAIAEARQQFARQATVA
jgi:DNA-binding HxlR family transcriptional regulator